MYLYTVIYTALMCLIAYGAWLSRVTTWSGGTQSLAILMTLVQLSAHVIVFLIYRLELTTAGKLVLADD